MRGVACPAVPLYDAILQGLPVAGEHRGDVADPDETHHARVRVDARDGKRRASCRCESAMHRLDQRDAVLVGAVGEDAGRDIGGLRRERPVARTVDDKQGGARPVMRGRPAVAANGLVGG